MKYILLLEQVQHQVDLCLRMYRHEVIKTRCYYPLTTAQWISEEIEFRKNAERDWKEAETIRLLVDFLFTAKASFSNYRHSERISKDSL